MTPMMVLWLACNPPPPPLLVLAPSSTQVPIERLTRDWAASAQTEATVIFDDSASLARMVDGGTPADLLLLSDATRMDDLVSREHVLESTRTALVGDDLAVVASTTASRAPQDLRALLEDDHVLLVPPADSAEALRLQMHLESVEAWDALEPRIRHLHDEEAVLAGIVADTNAVGVLSAGRASLGANLEVAFAISLPEPLLRIDGAVVSHAERPEAAAMLLAFLQSDGAEAPFRARGFRDFGGAVGSEPTRARPGPLPGGPSTPHPGGPGGPPVRGPTSTPASPPPPPPPAADGPHPNAPLPRSKAPPPPVPLPSPPK